MCYAKLMHACMYIIICIRFLYICMCMCVHIISMCTVYNNNVLVNVALFHISFAFVTI